MISLFDVSELKELISEAEKLEEKNYEADAWKTLKEQIEEAKNALIDGSEDEITSIMESLKDAMDNTKIPEKPENPDPEPPVDTPTENKGRLLAKEMVVSLTALLQLEIQIMYGLWWV